MHVYQRVISSVIGTNLGSLTTARRPTDNHDLIIRYLFEHSLKSKAGLEIRKCVRQEDINRNRLEKRSIVIIS